MKRLKYLLAASMLVLVGCGTGAPGHVENIDDVLGIDEVIIYYDAPVRTACGVETDTDNALYCPLDDTIYFGIPLMKTLTYAQYVVVLAHEDGHSEDYMATDYTVFQNEQFADCYAGDKAWELYQLGIFNEADIEEVKQWFLSLSPGDHGTPQERWDAFWYGYTGGDCYVYHS